MKYTLISILCIGLLGILGYDWYFASPTPGFPDHARDGARPSTTDAPANTNIAHQQVSQNSNEALYAQVRDFLSDLPNNTIGPSLVSVAGARALFAEGSSGPMIVQNEWMHLHPYPDSSVHVAIPQDRGTKLSELGRGEIHPRNPDSIMLYGPRDQDELDTFKSIVLEIHSLHQK